MRVIGKRILLKQDMTPLKTKGGVVLPDSMEVPLPRGRVCSVGDECYKVSTGCRVIINDVAGLSVKVLGKTYLLIDEDDVLVVLEGGDE